MNRLLNSMSVNGSIFVNVMQKYREQERRTKLKVMEENQAIYSSLAHPQLITESIKLCSGDATF